MALNERSTQTMLPLITVSVPSQSVAIFILFRPPIEPPKTELLYVYIVCVHIHNWDVVECNYLPFSTK